MGEPLDETISFLKDEFETTQKPLTIAEVVKHYDDFWEEQGYQDKRFTDSQTFYGVRFMVGFDHISAILTGVKETDFATDNIWAKNFGQDGKIDYPKKKHQHAYRHATITPADINYLQAWLFNA